MAFSIGLAVGLSCGNPQLIRDSLHDPFAESARSHLIPNFAGVKQAALNSGALGASISGAGPTIFAIFDTADFAHRALPEMVKYFAPLNAEGVVTTISQSGARLL